MSFKMTLTLFAVLVLLVVACWHLGVFTPAQQEQSPATSTTDSAAHSLVSPRLNSSDVKRVKLEVNGRADAVFEKVDGDWQIVEPIRARAVGWQVDDLVSTFSDATVQETFVPGKGEFAEITLEDIGLVEPQIKVTIDDAQRQVVFLAGKNVIASQDSYVKLADSETVAIVDVNFAKRIKKDIDAYRTKQILTLRKDKIGELVCTADSGRQYKFVKSNGRWLMISPVRAPADNDVVEKALDALVTLHAEEFVDDTGDALERYGLTTDAPAWTMTAVVIEKIEPADTAQQQDDGTAETQPASTQPTTRRIEHCLLIGSPVGLGVDQVYAKLPDHKWVVTIKKEDLEKIVPDEIAWRKKRLTDIAKGTISKVEITRSSGKKSVILTRQGGRWQLQFGEAELVGVEESAIDGLLDGITSMTAASFVDNPSETLAAEGLRDPVRRVRIYVADEVEPIELAIGKHTPSGLYRYVKRSGLDYLAAVAEDDLAQLFAPPNAYRDRRMLMFSVDDAVSLKLERNGRTYELTRRDNDQPWSLTSPVTFDADQDNVKNLILSCATLTAEKLIDASDLEEYDLDTPDVSLTITTDSWAEVIKVDATATSPAGQPASTAPSRQLVRKEHTLLVSRKDGRIYALAAGPDAQIAGEVGESVYGDLTAELVRSDLFDDLPAAATAERIEITRGAGSRYVFAKGGDAWRYPADPVVTVDGEKITDLVTAMSGIQSNRFVSFDASDAEQYGLSQPYVRIDVTYADGKQHWLAIGRASNSGRYAQASGAGGWIFELVTSGIEKFDKRLKDFVK